MIKKILSNHIRMAFILSAIIITIMLISRIFFSETQQELKNLENTIQKRSAQVTQIQEELEKAKEIVLFSKEQEQKVNQIQERLKKYAVNENILRQEITNFLSKYNTRYSTSGYTLSLKSITQDENFINVYKIEIQMNSPEFPTNEAQRELDTIILELQKNELQKYSKDISAIDEISIDKNSFTLSYNYAYKG